MAWYYEKQEEDQAMVIYGYGPETKEATGQLMYNKNTKEITILKIADNDTQFGADWAAGHLLDVVKDGYPDNKIIMIG